MGPNVAFCVHTQKKKKSLQQEQKSLYSRAQKKKNAISFFLGFAFFSALKEAIFGTKYHVCSVIPMLKFPEISKCFPTLAPLPLAGCRNWFWGDSSIKLYILSIVIRYICRPPSVFDVRPMSARLTATTYTELSIKHSQICWLTTAAGNPTTTRTHFSVPCRTASPRPIPKPLDVLREFAALAFCAWREVPPSRHQPFFSYSISQLS